MLSNRLLLTLFHLRSLGAKTVSLLAFVEGGRAAEDNTDFDRRLLPHGAVPRCADG